MRFRLKGGDVVIRLWRRTREDGAIRTATDVKLIAKNFCCCRKHDEGVLNGGNVIRPQEIALEAACATVTKQQTLAFTG